MGVAASRSIIRTRGKTPFKDIIDFISRINTSKFNTGHFQSLVKSGAFDRLGYKRQELLDNTEALYEWIRSLQEYHERGIINKGRIIENKGIAPRIATRSELRRIKRLKRERELTPDEEEFLENTKGLRLNALLKVGEEEPVAPVIARYKYIPLDISELMQQAEHIGCYIGTHPATIIYPNSTRIAEALTGRKESLAGVVSSMKIITDRNGNEMAFMGYGDGTGIAEGIIFASTFRKLKAAGTIPKPGDLIETFGKVDQTDPEVKVIVFSVSKYRSN